MTDVGGSISKGTFLIFLQFDFTAFLEQQFLDTVSLPWSRKRYVPAHTRTLEVFFYSSRHSLLLNNFHRNRSQTRVWSTASFYDDHERSACLWLYYNKSLQYMLMMMFTTYMGLNAVIKYLVSIMYMVSTQGWDCCSITVLSLSQNQRLQRINLTMLWRLTRSPCRMATDVGVVTLSKDIFYFPTVIVFCCWCWATCWTF